MYIKGHPYGGTYYDSGGSQHSRRAPFLLLAAGDEIRQSGAKRDTLYACVRKVALSQLGQFMMGFARVGDQSITVSGCFGHDGLPLHYNELSERARKEFVQVPDEIAAAYWSDTGHSSPEEPAYSALLAFGRKLADERK